MASAETIKKLLEAGGNVELTGSYSAVSVKEFIRIAVAKGGQVVVTGNYSGVSLVEFAKLGGTHFTYRQLPET